MEELRAHSRALSSTSELVEAFITLLEREGPAFVTDASGDFDSELAFERRVREIAAPRSAHPA